MVGSARDESAYGASDSVERVDDFQFHRTLISNHLTWSGCATAAVKKAQQCIHFIRLLKKSCLDEKLLMAFYRSSVESILVYSITVWNARCAAADEKAVQRVIETEQKIIGCVLPSLEKVAKVRYKSNTLTITKDSSHSAV